VLFATFVWQIVMVVEAAVVVVGPEHTRLLNHGVPARMERAAVMWARLLESLIFLLCLRSNHHARRAWLVPVAALAFAAVLPRMEELFHGVLGVVPGHRLLVWSTHVVGVFTVVTRGGVASEAVAVVPLVFLTGVVVQATSKCPLGQGTCLHHAVWHRVAVASKGCLTWAVGVSSRSCLVE
jgi:hypothetical protein